MTVRISELTELSTDLSQLDLLPIVDLSAGETKSIQAGNLIAIGISGAPSGFIDISKLNQNSSTKINSYALENTGVASGVYGSADTVVSFAVNAQGQIVTATGVAIAINASAITGLASVATSGTYQSLSGLPALGTLASQDASSVSVSGGTIANVVFQSNNVAISGGTISGITDLAIADGGTGASDALNARANLGLTIGTNVQAYSPVLSGIANLYNGVDEIIYSTASGVLASQSLTSHGRSLIASASASGTRSVLGIGSIGTQDANSVAITGGSVSGVTFNSSAATITGGSISGITDLAIADGGTGASTASGARINLGLAIGTDVQAYSAVLDQVETAYDVANVFAYSSASGVVATANVGTTGLAVISGSTASAIRSTLNLGTIATQNANSVVISGGTIENVALASSNVTITGGTISGITSLAIADGGTGASTAENARINLGLAIGSNVQGYSTALQNITTVASGSDLFFYTTASGSVSAGTFSSIARTLVANATASGMRSTLGLGQLATQDAVIVTSGFIAADAIQTVNYIDESITGAKIAINTIPLNKLAISSQSDVILGRSSVGSGTYQEIPCTPAARSILDDASIEDIRSTLGLGTLATQNGSFSGTSTGINTGDQTITLTGDVTGTGTGSFAATIATGAVTETKIADGSITTNKVVNGGISANKLADQSASIVAAASPSASGAFIGQQWINTNNAVEYTWTGSEWLQQSALGAITASGDNLYSFSTTYPDGYSAIITPALNTQTANRVFVGPASGSDAAPTFRSLVGGDLPTATTGTKGAVAVGAGLSMTGDAIGHTNSVASGVYYKVQVDAQGHVSSGATILEAADIPSLDASKITTGTFGSGFIANDAILATNLANYSTTKFGEALPTADFIGQYFFNPLSKDLYLWDGNVWNPVGISIGEIVLAGTYNASGNTIASTTSEGSAAGLTIGQPLPTPSATFNKYYVVVESGGTGTSPAPQTALAPPDIILCNGSSWVHVDVSSTYVSQTASQVTFTPAASISSTTVQAALEEVSNECRNASNITSGVLGVAYGGTGQSSYAKGNILVASGTSGFTKLTVGSNGTVLTADSSQTSGVKWAVPASGTVLSVNATAPLAVVSGTTTPHLTISGATTSSTGVVQLSDSTSTTSSVLAATSTAVKSAYDLANAALPAAGGTMTGALNLGTSVDIVFEGSVDDGFETTLTVANPTADRTITLPNVTGTIITTGDSLTVTNGMLAGSIADSKLSTISTAGKVSNSATTATASGIVNAIVARDANGDFTAGIITATIDDGTY